MSHITDKKLVNERGFSLIELLLVMFITFSVISIVMKLSFDHIATFIDEQIQYELQLKIREAQFLAYANSEDFYIPIIEGERSYSGCYSASFPFHNGQVVENIYDIHKILPFVEKEL